MKLALVCYGSTCVPLNGIRGVVGKLLDHSNAGVRNAKRASVVEMHRWFGRAVEPLYKGVKGVMVKELERSFEKNSEKAVKTQKTRSEIARREAGGDGDKKSEDKDYGVDG